jgi:proteic killer suppression protein
VAVTIKSFKCAETEKMFKGERVKRFANIQAVAMRKLAILNRAGKLADLRVPPGNRLEALKRDRLGQHSIRVNDQFRVCFVWTGTDVENVEIVDYH